MPNTLFVARSRVYLSLWAGEDYRLILANQTADLGLECGGNCPTLVLIRLQKADDFIRRTQVADLVEHGRLDLHHKPDDPLKGLWTWH